MNSEKTLRQCDSSDEMRSDCSTEMKCDRRTDSSSEIDLTEVIEMIDLAEVIAAQQMSGGEK